MYCNHEYTNQEGRSLEKQVDSLEKNLAAANSRMAELETSRIVTCVYCGHEYPNGTPSSQNLLLTEHIKVCEKHPMRLAEKQLELTRQQRDAIFEKLEQAEAQNKRMQEALNEIANSNLQTIDWAMKRWIDSRVVNIAKAALEVNP